MAVFYLVLCPKLLHRYLMCLLQKNKLSILSIISIPIKHTATMVYPSLCLNYVHLRLLSLSKLSFRIALILASFQIVGNMLMFNLFTKNSRQIISNYRPISLLPICSKILEKIVFDQVYAFLNTNNLLSVNQSGFRPGDSTIYQLLSITSTIYDSFENYDETRAIFLDISIAFDR